MNTSSPAVSNNLVWAILSTLFCCLPLGIVSIVHAAKVNGLLAQGDIAGAQRASANAKTWCWVATALAIIGLLWVTYSLTLGGGVTQWQQIMEQVQSAQ